MKLLVLWAILTCSVKEITSTEGTINHEQVVNIGKSLHDLKGIHTEQSEVTNGSSFAFNYGFIVVPTCKAFLEEYAKRSSEFTRCLIENARPFRFCETCVIPYERASVLFSDMTGDSSCSKELLMADRVQVVRLVNTNIESIWKSANCPDCFETIKEDNNSTVNFTLTNRTLHFIDLFNNMTQCLNNSQQEGESQSDIGNTSVCAQCKTEYRSLNNHFTFMLDQSSNGVCMDVVDMMNYTRLKWSKDLHCSNRQGKIGPVLAITCLICALPVAFYITNRVFRQSSDRKTIRIQRRLKFPQITSSYGSMNGNQPVFEDSHSRSNSFR